MKKRDIWLTFVIIVVSFGILYIYYLTNSLVKGYIEVDAGGAKAELSLSSALFGQERLTSESAPTLINKRILRPQYLTLSKEQDGKKYQISSRGPWGKISNIKIKNNDTIKLRLGQPLLIQPSISKVSNTVSIRFSIIGQAGEEYEISRRETVPKIEIKDEQGNTLATGNFSYG